MSGIILDEYAGSNDIFHPSNILGVNFEEWEAIMSHSGLFNIKKQIIVSSWTNMLPFDIEFWSCDSRFAFHNGERSFGLWFRILGTECTSSRSSRSFTE